MLKFKLFTIHPILARPTMSVDKLLELAYLPTGWTELNTAIALSGGADSVALLCAMHQLKSQLGGAGRLVALHVNHHLRAQESDEDAGWCLQLSKSLGIEIKVLDANTAEFAKQTGQGLEAAAREQRYQLLTQAAEDAGVRYLATAHTRNDQVETILFRTLRGTGLRGLAGIPPTRSLTSTVTLLRPLLDCSRKILTDYLAKIQQDYRTDSTNRDQQFTRNRLRHELLPKLREQFNTDLDEALLRLATQAGAAQRVIEQLAGTLLAEASFSSERGRLSMAWATFASPERVVVCEALRMAWRQAKLPEQSMNYEWWCKLAGLIQNPSDAHVLNLPGNVRASIAGERFLLEW